MSTKKHLSRRDFIKLVGGSSVAAAAGTFFPKGSQNPLLAPPQDYAPKASDTLPGYVKELDKPYYVNDIVSSIARFDERARAFSKASYVPGDGFYEQFYELYPELKGESETLAPYRDPAPKKAENAGISYIGYTFARVSFDPCGPLGSDEVVTPKVAEQVTPVDAEDMAIRIKEFCKAMGAFDVKIGPLDQRWVYSHRGANKNDTWGQPIDFKHKTAISIAWPQDPKFMNDLAGPGSNLEVGKAYTYMAATSIMLADAIAALGYPARAHHVRNYLLLQVPVAIDAGMGELGRMGIVVHPEIGPNPRLVTVTTDMPLAYDKPIEFGLQDFCANCKICAEACPSGAISAGEKVERNGVMVWDLDEVKCLTFWGTNGNSCGICQVSCPWSKTGNWVHNAARYYASTGGSAGTVMAGLDKVFYGDYLPGDHPNWLK